MTSDAADRRRAVEEVDRSFVLEASAGTGKTNTLIERILRLVLVAGPSGMRLANVAAITFTEKAAGEMKVRLRQEFERRAAASGPQAERARQALGDLETAAIQTIHAFAVGLLKARPVEAGLDPRFRAIDEAESELLFEEVWEAWLKRAIAERRGPVERALRGGMGLSDLRTLAWVLARQARAVRDLALDPPPSEAEVAARSAALLEEGREFERRIVDRSDKLVPHFRAALQWLRTGRGLPEQAGNKGRAGAWQGGSRTTGDVRRLVAEVAELSLAPQQRLLDDVVRWLQSEFLAEWQARKRREGVLEFDDQLLGARELLVRSRAARRDFQAEFATLLVDEFQDTDPVQLEIALLLSSPDLDETRPEKLRPGPGRLFIVGDPKQSIYRFRGADIETYMGMVEADPGRAPRLERLALTRNFRSVPSILRFVDALFGGIMTPPATGRYQPPYLAFGGAGERAGESDPPHVHLLGNGTSEGDRDAGTRAFCEREASRIARLIRQVEGNPDWRIGDTGAARARPPRFGDIAILLPVLTRANILEDALREAEIPYVLEGGKFYYARSEVSSAITVLGAVSNPNDRVALYGALRSIFFGLSDEDLLRARIEGLPLDYRAEVPAESKLARPFALLGELARLCDLRPASEILELLLAGTGAREVLAARAGGLQSLSNLAKLSRTLRARQSSRTFSEVMELVKAMDQAGQEESESRIMEERSDAVRVLTVHRAKGLDFGIVFVAGLGLQRVRRAGQFVADHHEAKRYALRLLGKPGLRSPSWKELERREREREDAERVRLLYVAMTRARDHLIVSTHVAWREGKPVFEGTRLDEAYPVLAALASSRPPLVRKIDAAALEGRGAPRRTRPDAAAPSGDWGAELRAGYEELGRLRSIPASRGRRTPAGATVDETDDGVSGARVPDLARSRAVRLGVAFHEAMELADWRRTECIQERAREAGARHRLDPAAVRLVADMMRSCFGSDLIGRALAAEDAGRKTWRELPFVRPLAGAPGAVPGIEEGRIDLAFQEEQGWVVVDYKTDTMPRGEADPDRFFRARYAPQLEEYAEALSAVGVAPRACYLLLARTGRAVEVPLPKRVKRAPSLDTPRGTRTMQPPLPFFDQGGDSNG